VCGEGGVGDLAQRYTALGDEWIENKGDAVGHVDSGQLFEVEGVELKALSIHKKAVQCVLPHNTSKIGKIDTQPGRAHKTEQ